MKYRLELNNISKSFGDVHANKNINLQVKKGEIQALLGENGAGKSTLVKMIYGILAPDKGEIHWNNEQIKGNHPDKAKKLGIHMIFQHFSLLDSVSFAPQVKSLFASLLLKLPPTLRLIVLVVIVPLPRYSAT